MDVQLVKAVRSGNLKEFKLLTDANIHLLDGSTVQGSTALHLAARFGHKTLVNEILAKNPSLVMRQNHRGDTPLHVAAKAGDVGVATSLIRHFQQNDTEIGRDQVFTALTVTNMELNTPLHDAISNRHGDVAVELINTIRAKPEILILVNKAGESALSLAVEVKLYGVVSAILKASQSSSLYRNSHDMTVLHTAIIRNDFDIMKLLISTDSELLKGQEKDGKSALHYAAALGYMSMVQELIRCDPSLVYLSDKLYRSPIHTAAQYGRLDVLKVILQGCPDSIELQDKYHRNVLHLAAHNGMCNVVKYLMKLPDVVDLNNATDVDGNTPLHLASINYHDSVVCVLVDDLRINLSITNKDIMTALEVAESQAKQAYAGSILDNSPPIVAGSNPTVATSDCAKASPARKMGFGVFLTIRALMEASAKRGKYLEDILNRRKQFLRIERPIQNKRAREVASTLTLMATLVATVTFNAAFTLPGGFNSGDSPDGGLAVLARKVAFQAFIVTDAIALTSSMTAAVLIVWSTSRPENESFLISLSLGRNLTWISLTAMGLAFVCGLFAVLSDIRWLAILVCFIGGLFPLILYLVPTLYEWGAKQPRSNLANSPFRQYALLVRDSLEGNLGYRT